MKRLLTTTACIAALSAPAFAGTEYKAETELETETELEQSLENTGEAIEQTADNAVEATEDAVDATAEATADAGEAIEETAEDAAQATADAAEATGDAIEDGVVATAATLDEATREAAIMMDDSWDADIAEIDAPEIKRDGWQVADMETFEHGELAGMRVYTSNDEWIGEIDNVVVDRNGRIQGAVLGVGGFLGIGEKDVLVSFDSLTLKEEVDGDDMRAYVDATEESLEELPAYPS